MTTKRTKMGVRVGGRGIPLGPPRLYDFPSLPIYHPELADTVLKFENGNYNSIKNAACFCGKRTGRKFTVKRVGTTVFVWRLA